MDKTDFRQEPTYSAVSWNASWGWHSGSGLHRFRNFCAQVIPWQTPQAQNLPSGGPMANTANSGRARRQIVAVTCMAGRAVYSSPRPSGQRPAHNGSFAKPPPPFEVVTKHPPGLISEPSILRKSVAFIWTTGGAHRVATIRKKSLETFPRRVQRFRRFQ